MPSIHEVVEDADAALERFDQASSPAGQRRAMREVLAHLYFLHQYRVSEPDKAFDRALMAGDARGDVTQGVIYARGKLAHHVTREMGPLLLGGDYDPQDFDMRYYYAGTLTWLYIHEMTPRDGEQFEEHQGKHGPASLERYQRTVAGQPVRDTLATARDFLVAPPGMLPL